MAVRTSLMDFQVPKIVHEDVGRPSRRLRDRAARPRLRSHVRELAAPRAALLARGRRSDRRQDRGRRPRVHDAPGRPRGRHRHHPQPQEPHRPACTARRPRSRCTSPRRAPASSRAADIEAPADLEILNPELEIAHVSDKGKLEMTLTIGRGARLRPGRAQPRPGDDDRRHPDRLDLLAGAPRRVRGRGRPRRSAHGLRQARPRRHDRRLARPARRDRPGRRDPHPPARDLHRPRRRSRASAEAARRGGRRGAGHARDGELPDRGARARRPLLQLPEARRHRDDRRPRRRSPRTSSPRSRTSVASRSRRSARRSARTG